MTCPIRCSWRDDTDESTVDVILGSLPYGRRITVELRKRK